MIDQGPGWTAAKKRSEAFLDHAHHEIIVNRPDSKFCAVNLTLKQGMHDGSAFETLTRHIVSKCIRSLLQNVDKCAFKNAYARNSKKLVRIPAIERSISDRLHVHMLLEIPPHMPFDEFREIIQSKWAKNLWSAKQLEIVLIEDKSRELGFTKYFSKDAWKDSDVIDIDNVYLGQTMH